MCIDARAPDGPSSGIRSVVVGLAGAFSELADGNEEYLFLAFNDSHEWLRPHIKGPSRILPTQGGVNPVWKRIGRRVPGLGKAWRTLHQPLVARKPGIPRSDSAVENTAIHVVHFTQSSGFRTSLPNIYQIHDLQHLHFPGFFTQSVRAEREFQYRAFCAQSSLITVMSQYGKEDLIRSYGVPEGKVKVVPWAQVLTGCGRTVTLDDLEATRKKFRIHGPFAFYPAQTWEHKNHLRLLEALAIVRDRYREEIPLICSGHRNDFYPKIQRRARQLGLASLANFVGYVNATELECLYRLARCMVFPSMFEGWGLPIAEAFASGLPVMCSNIRPLREQVGDAALTFDPTNAEVLACTLYRVWRDEALRRRLRETGRERGCLFSWNRTARLLRAHYRVLGQRPLTDEDRMLLSEAPLV